MFYYKKRRERKSSSLRRFLSFSLLFLSWRELNQDEKQPSCFLVRKFVVYWIWRHFLKVRFSGFGAVFYGKNGVLIMWIRFCVCWNCSCLEVYKWKFNRKCAFWPLFAVTCEFKSSKMLIYGIYKQKFQRAFWSLFTGFNKFKVQKCWSLWK
jgi:hypothetical protein